MKFPFFRSKKSKDNELLNDYLKSIIRHAVLLEREEVDDEPSIGTSKIGGVPHLPEGFQWPYYESDGYDGTHENRPLSFVAQIDLAAMTPFEKDNLLPKSGYLYFFYDIVSQKWGFDPADKGCARVYYFDVPANQLKFTALPDDLEDDVRVPLSVISFETKDELPAYDEFCELTDTTRFGDDFNWDSYDETVEKTIESQEYSPEDVCKMLGYADLMQESMIGECAMVDAGIYCGNAEAYRSISEEKKADIAKDTPNWILLAQFGTLSEEIMFGDCGCIYFYIRKADLAALRFDRVWLCLQCG